MSENSITVTFTANPESVREHELVELTNSHLLLAPAGEHHYSADGDRHSLVLGFADIDTSRLDDYLKAMAPLGPRQLLLECWYENVGETEFFGQIGDEIHRYDNPRDYLADLNSKPASPANEKTTPTFDFGRDDRAGTLLIRMRVKAKKRQDLVRNLFRPLDDGPSDAQIARFDAAFSAIQCRDERLQLRSQNGTLGFKDFDGQWHNSQEGFMRAFVFFQQEGDVCYIGFDMTRLGWQPEKLVYGAVTRQEERPTLIKRRKLEIILEALGVNMFPCDRAWAKYHANDEEEIFVLDFDGAMAICQALTPDDTWRVSR